MGDVGARFERLIDIMRLLRAPDGCPWDREQTHASLRPFVLEETYEVLEAIDSGDPAQLREELGDFLFEAVFLARLSEEAGDFSIGDAIDAVCAKLIRRHPHVFDRPADDDGTRLTSAEVVEKWETIKAREREAHERRRVDELLGKISQGGMQSLTGKERRFLEKTSKRWSGD